MSISHQRRQGAGTVDGQALEWSKKPDLYKMAVLYCPNQNLLPVTQSWEIGINENPINDLPLGGLYFGKWILNHNSQDRADNDNGRKRSQAFLKYANDVVARTMIIISGDDILSWGTETTEHYGFATSLHVHKLEVDQQPQHGATLSFIGFKISNDPGFLFPKPIIQSNIGQSGNVGLTAQDLTNAGYTYQWSEKDGKGTFTNPNSPNTQFVPDGNGHYTPVLIVTDSSGVISAPVEVPVTVDIAHSVTLINKDKYPIKLLNSFTLGAYETKRYFTDSNKVLFSPFDVKDMLLWRGWWPHENESFLSGGGQPFYLFIDNVPNGLPDEILNLSLAIEPTGAWVIKNTIQPIRVESPVPSGQNGFSLDVLVPSNSDFNFGQDRDMTITSTQNFKATLNNEASTVYYSSFDGTNYVLNFGKNDYLVGSRQLKIELA